MAGLAGERAVALVRRGRAGGTVVCALLATQPVSSGVFFRTEPTRDRPWHDPAQHQNRAAFAQPGPHVDRSHSVLRENAAWPGAHVFEQPATCLDHESTRRHRDAVACACSIKGTQGTPLVGSINALATESRLGLRKWKICKNAPFFYKFHFEYGNTLQRSCLIQPSVDVPSRVGEGTATLGIIHKMNFTLKALNQIRNLDSTPDAR